MLAVESLDTVVLPEGERFGFWHDFVARESVPSRVSSDHAKNFRAQAQVVGLGDVVLSSWSYPSLDMHRTGKLIRRGDPEMYHLALPLSGSGGVMAERRENELVAGEFTFVDTSRPHMSTHRAVSPEQDQLTTLTILIPHALIPLHPNKVAMIVGARIPATRGIGVLLGQFVRQIITHPEQYDSADAPRLDNIARDLMAATLAQRLDAAETLPGEVRNSSLRIQIKAFIDRNLGDPDLSPSAVAAAHHISIRALHRLFEAEDSGVAELIRLQRLNRCARDLRDPSLAKRPIYSIAAQWGFPDKAHFSRLFRAAYGVPPQAFRTAGGLTAATKGLDSQ
ncbi:helix-turn-helix domain-containing protein [Micromonospora sp. NPDC051296]|uniref:AraC-like ligand-binding domain-containing protein n=1 Tax=Micromonospora sp. NPDC051296 TaxID=3155046 RepID=UPI00342B9E55